MKRRFIEAPLHQIAWKAGTPVIFCGAMKTKFILLVAVALSALAWSSVAPQAQGGEIHEAAKAGNLEKVKELLRANPELITSEDERSKATPLELAAAIGYPFLVELLLARGAQIDRKDTFPLNYAVGPSPFVRSERGSGLIGWVWLDDAKKKVERAKYYEDHITITKLLLAKGADVNARDRWGMTPLHWAAMSVHLFLSKDCFGGCALNPEAEQFYKDVAKLLVKKRRTSTPRPRKIFLVAREAHLYTLRRKMVIKDSWNYFFITERTSMRKIRKDKRPCIGRYRECNEQFGRAVWT